MKWTVLCYINIASRDDPQLDVSTERPQIPDLMIIGLGAFSGVLIIAITGVSIYCCQSKYTRTHVCISITYIYIRVCREADIHV